MRKCYIIYKLYFLLSLFFFSTKQIKVISFHFFIPTKYLMKKKKSKISFSFLNFYKNLFLVLKFSNVHFCL